MKQIFYSYKNKIPSQFRSYSPFPKIDERNFWDNISADIKNEILKQANSALEKIQKEGWPALNISLWHEFSETGNRVNFENNYFNRRNLLTIFVLAQCFENSDKFIPQIIDGIFLLCEESGWQLPAHNSYKRDTPQLPYPDSSRPVFDLFAGETANLLSVIYLILKDKLDKTSPMICERIEIELNKRIINPYLTEHFWWMGKDEEPMCNWTPWCTQNALITAFSIPQSYETRKKVIEQSLYSLDAFLKDYGDDGCCSEGAEYYRHAGLTFYNAVEILNQVCNGLYSETFKIPKIKNLAEYILNMNIPGTEFYFNFADCSPKAGKCGAREFLFGKAINSSELCNFVSNQWKASSAEEKIFNLTSDKLSQSNIYYILQSILNNKEICSYSENKNSILKTAKNIWYESIGLFIVHKGKFSLACKAGDNGDSHNHNDTGSFILYKNGDPFVIDVGVENYTQKTFSPQRYEIWTMQSSWHNLPTLNKTMQKDGKEFCASDVEISDNKISMNIAMAYPEEAGINSYLRKFSAEENKICLTDEFDFSDKSKCENTISLIVKDKPEFLNGNLESSNSEKTISVGTTGKIILNGNCSVIFEEKEISDSRLRKTWPEKIYRILIDVKETKSFQISFE